MVDTMPGEVLAVEFSPLEVLEQMGISASQNEAGGYVLSAESIALLCDRGCFVRDISCIRSLIERSRSFSNYGLIKLKFMDKGVSQGDVLSDKEVMRLIPGLPNMVRMTDHVFKMNEKTILIMVTNTDSRGAVEAAATRIHSEIKKQIFHTQCKVAFAFAERSTPFSFLYEALQKEDLL